MLTSLIHQITTQWHFRRWVALGAGLFFFISWLFYREPLAVFISAFFLIQAITNTGCLVGYCAPHASHDKGNINDEVNYKEIR